MKNLFFALFLCVSLPSVSLGSMYVICAQEMSEDLDLMVGYELEISSESDSFHGSVGENWEMKVERDGDWLSPQKNVQARSYVVKKKTIVEIALPTGFLLNQSSPLVYRLIDLYGEEPYLEKFSVQNPKAVELIDTFQCRSSAD